MTGVQTCALPIFLEEELEVDEEQSEHERRVTAEGTGDSERFERHAPPMDDLSGGRD